MTYDVEFDNNGDEEDSGQDGSQSSNEDGQDRYHPSKENVKQEKKNLEKGGQNKSSKNPSTNKQSGKSPDIAKSVSQKTGGLANEQATKYATKAAETAGPKITKYLGAANKARQGDYMGAALDAGKQAVKDAVKEGVKQGVIAFFGSPAGWITLAIIILLIIIIFFIFFLIVLFSSESYRQQQQQGQNETLHITKSGPDKANVGDMLEYKIDVSETKSVSDIVITDHMPEDTEFVSASWKGEKIDKEGNTVTWHAKDHLASSGASLKETSFTIRLTLRATKNNTNLINWAEATSVYTDGGGGGPVTEGYVPPNNSNCGGKYQLTSSIKKNFGDPECNFNKNQLHTMLKQMDPKNANAWFFKIVPCESGYNPNAYAPPSTGTPDSNGAWGLFQMGSSTPPGKPPPAQGKNGKFDRGDVNWPLQARNATSYGKMISSLGAYWACAR